MQHTGWVLRGLDLLLTLALATLVGGTLIAFGGAVWWGRPVIVGLAVLCALLLALRFAFSHSAALVASPMLLVGVAFIALSVFQLAPLPGRLAARLAPNARASHALGALPARVLEDDPEAVLAPLGGPRTPATIDRAATLRWTVGALCCLLVMAVVLHHVDRLDRTLAVVGAIVAAMFLVTIVGLVQWLGGASRPLAVLEPGTQAAWAPTIEDLATIPGHQTLRSIASEARPGQRSWALPWPVGPSAPALAGGPGGFLALAALALPLALGLILQILTPRSTRESFRDSLRASERGGLALVILFLTTASALVAGLVSSRVAAAPIAIGLVIACLGALARGRLGAAVGATLIILAALVAGVTARESAEASLPPGFRDAKPDTVVWNEALRIGLDFPLLGAGFGSFATAEPYYKNRDQAASAAGSSMLQLWAEAGFAGVILLAVGLVLALARIPAAVARTGSADRPLAFGLLGSVASFLAFSTVHWSVELIAVGLAASAVLGACERWLCGGSDLFVEPA